MNYNCKYCDYVDKCSRRCEYDSFLCKMHRSFPKGVKRPYKEILYENTDLKLENKFLKDKIFRLKAYLKQRIYNLEKGIFTEDELSDGHCHKKFYEGEIYVYKKILERVENDKYK